MTTWDAVWSARQPPRSRSDASVLRRLMDADGLDSGFAHVGESAWRAFVHRTAGVLELARPESVFEVGCGAGAFLQPLAEAGHPVSGIDLSPGLIDLARASGLGSQFMIGEATTVHPIPRADAVVSMGVFLYFRSHGYAGRVLDRMIAKSKKVVAILDLPDTATRVAAMAARHRAAGGEAAYNARYAGLEHRFYDRDWIVDALAARGVVDISVEDQMIDGYGNGPFRFNAWGFVG